MGNEAVAIRVAQPTGLAAGLIQAQRAIERVAKTGTNQFHRYAYATAEDMIDEARGALGVGGLAVFARKHECVLRGDLLWLCVKYDLVHESGERIEIESETPIIPEKGRPEDKAVSVAKTYDLAYTLRSLLLIPRGDDGGVDNRDDRNKQPRRQEQRGSSNFERPPPADHVDPPPPADPLQPATKTEAVKQQLKQQQPKDAEQQAFENEVQELRKEIWHKLGRDKAAWEWSHADGLQSVPRSGKDLEARRKAYLGKAYGLRDRLLPEEQPPPPADDEPPVWFNEGANADEPGSAG